MDRQPAASSPAASAPLAGEAEPMPVTDGFGNVAWDTASRGRPPDRMEIIADGVVHGLGLVLALVGFGALLNDRGVWASPGTAVAALLYGAVLVLGLAVSMTYNLWPEGEMKRILRRGDHSAIFLLIAATYTPFLQRAADHTPALVMLAVIWALALAGVALKCLAPLGFHRWSVILYLAMGWSGLAVIGPIHDSVPGISFALLFVGGAIYSLGVVFHVWEALRFQTAIWHLFVVAAAAVHFTAVLACLRAT